jgi:ribonuclease HI
VITDRVILRFSALNKLEEAQEKAHKLVMDAHRVFQNGKTVYRDRMTADAWKDNMTQYLKAIRAWDLVSVLARKAGAVDVEAMANKTLRVCRERYHEAEGLWEQALRDEKAELERPEQW